MKIISIVLSLTLFLNSCSKSEEPDPVYKEIVLDQKSSALVSSDNAFGLDLFQKVVSSEGDKNTMVSPLSISLALAMTYNGADNGTKAAMETALKKEGFSIEDINSSYQKLTEALLQADPKVIISIANSIWYRDTYPVEQAFIDVNKEHYNAEVSALDFTRALQAKNTINNWVNDKTQGKIKEIVDEITPTHIMFLINAIYFKGTWKYAFDKGMTIADYPFYSEDGEGQTKVPMMVQKGEFAYTSQSSFEAVELPYGNGHYSMVILLPGENYTTRDIMDELDNANWNLWLTGMQPKNNIQIYLPKFTFEYKKELNEVLSQMGMGVAFTSNADFSNINKANNLFISKVKHKSFIEVNEEGTEAAAVTSVEMVLTSVNPGDPYHFIVNRPFLFAIREKDTNSIVFIGRVVQPGNK